MYSGHVRAYLVLLVLLLTMTAGGMFYACEQYFATHDLHISVGVTPTPTPK